MSSVEIRLPASVDTVMSKFAGAIADDRERARANASDNDPKKLTINSVNRLVERYRFAGMTEVQLNTFLTLAGDEVTTDGQLKGAIQ